MSHSLDHGPSQRDGTFSDALIDDQHPLHPRTQFEHAEEWDEEGMQRAAQAVVSMLSGREKNAKRFPISDLIPKLQELKRCLDQTLPKLGGCEAQADSLRLVRAYERALRWIWGEGKLEPYPIFLQFAAFTWTFFPTITGASSQVELLRFLGLRDKQQFNRYVAGCRDEFNYFNPLMRDADAVENFRNAAKERTAHAA